MPFSTDLFQSIQGFIELSKLVGTNNIKTRREGHLYFLIENSMKEYIIDIKLLKVPMFDSCKRHKNSNISNFNNMRKFIKVINIFQLSVTLIYKPSLVYIHGSIGMILDLVIPFATNWSFTYRKIHNGQSTVILKSSYLNIHGIFPTVKFGGLVKGIWFEYRWNKIFEIFVNGRTIFIR